MILAFPAALLLMMAGCASECYENQNALPLAEFRYVEDSVARECAMDSLRVYGVGAPGDSTLWNGGNVSELYLPFRVDHDTTQYVFEHLRLGVRDTVTFLYERAPRLVSAECGVSYVFKIRSIASTGPFIDSVACPGGEITNVNRSNLLIYLHDYGNDED